jgi:CheY-like chemotaxis protein
MAEGPVILIVDDDPLLGGVIEACLDFEGADVRTAHTLAAARDALVDDIDHVVLDRRLPDGDGLDLLPDVSDQCPEADVVVFSAYDDDGSGPADLVRVPKTDVAALVDLLGLERDGVPVVGAAADPIPPVGSA